MTPVVPVFGIPAISEPEMLAECVRSIDADVARLVVIDNSPDGSLGDVARNAAPASVAELVVVTPPDNLGYSGSLNFLIRTHAYAPWWVWANADAVFAPGEIATIAERIESRSGPFLVGIRDYRLFALNAEMVETVGFWDENLHPIYCEDTDYQRRMLLAGAPFLFLPGSTGHFGSATIRDARYGRENQRTYPDNRRYYTAKWGGDIGAETFSTPFDRGGSVADWTLDLRRLRANRWTTGDGGDGR